MLTEHVQVCTVGLFRQMCVCALCLCAFNSCQVVHVSPPIVTRCSLRDMLTFDSELSLLVYKYAANNTNHWSSSIISAHCNFQLIKYWLFVMARHTSSKNKFLLYTPKGFTRRNRAGGKNQKPHGVWPESVHQIVNSPLCVLERGNTLIGNADELAL